MAGPLKEKLQAMAQPIDHSAEEEIWEVVRSWLVISRITCFVAMIALAELLDDMMMAGLSVSLWSLIIGIPVFVILSIAIIWGDRWMKKYLEENLKGEVDRVHGRQSQLNTPGLDNGRTEVLLHPIHQRQ
jgi:uncharacterized membrane protein